MRESSGAMLLTERQILMRPENEDEIKKRKKKK